MFKILFVRCKAFLNTPGNSFILYLILYGTNGSIRANAKGVGEKYPRVKGL